MKRNTAATIFKTVVFAGAMLGAPACSKKGPSNAASTTPKNTTTEPAKTGDPAMMQSDGTANKPEAHGDHNDHGDPCGGDPCGGDPCGGERPRGGDDEGGGMGRGFILS
jgi:hypothetical protein